MITFSTYMWKNPMDETANEKAYAKNQISKVMSFDEFVKHIAEHNGVFTRGTVKGVVSDTCTCLVEQLLNGCKVQFGELGTFSISITSEPAESLAQFSAKNIKEVNILFAPGEVSSRAAQVATLKAEKTGETIVDLTAIKGNSSSSSSGSESPTEPDEPDNSGGSATGGNPL